MQCLANTEVHWLLEAGVYMTESLGCEADQITHVYIGKRGTVLRLHSPGMNECIHMEKGEPQRILRGGMSAQVVCLCVKVQLH